MSGDTHAAFSQIDITPDFPTEMIGCYREDSRPQGVLHRLYAQTLLFRGGYKLFCLVAIDAIGLTVALSDTLRANIAQRLEAEKTHVMLCFSHTHSAPDASAFSLGGSRFFAYLTEKVLLCVETAKENLSPCRLGWGMTATTIGENRREGCTALDDRLGALKIVNALTGMPIAMLLRVTAHANVLMTQSPFLSSDYFGSAREALGVLFGCPVLMVQGAAGNVKPIGVPKIHGGTPADLEPIVAALVRSAQELSFDMPEAPALRMLSKEIQFVADVPSKEEAERIAKASGMDASSWLAECDRLRGEGIRTQCQTREIQFFQIGPGCLCGVAEEIFCELALEAWRETGNPLLFLNGYTNGCTGYLPTAQEWEKGGYETHDSYLTYFPFHGHVMPFRKNTADDIVELVVGTWKELL